MITFPNAKINLGLYITEKRPDGYHNLETIFYPIPLEDALEIQLLPNHKPCEWRLICNGINIDSEAQQNLVVKAYLLLAKEFELPAIEIYLNKYIPTGAGMGGGSSDAAFMLKMLNSKFNLNLSISQLEAYAAQLGADCAFFIQNKPMMAEGIGNLFSPVNLSLKDYQIYIVKPDVFVSTAKAFSCIHPQKTLSSLKEDIQRPIEEWKEYIHNDFEDSVFPQFPVIKEIKEKLYSMGALYAAMSGSGSSVFGIFHPDAEIPNYDFGKHTFTAIHKLA